MQHRYNNRLLRMAASTMVLPGGGGESSIIEGEDVVVDGSLSASGDEDGDAKIGVLLLNLGGPEKSEDVEGTCFGLLAVVSCVFL